MGTCQESFHEDLEHSANPVQSFGFHKLVQKQRVGYEPELSAPLSLETWR
jgi:hypothetical protein